MCSSTDKTTLADAYWELEDEVRNLENMATVVDTMMASSIEGKRLAATLYAATQLSDLGRPLQAAGEHRAEQINHVRRCTLAGVANKLLIKK